MASNSTRAGSKKSCPGEKSQKQNTAQEGEATWSVPRKPAYLGIHGQWQCPGRSPLGHLVLPGGGGQFRPVPSAAQRFAKSKGGFFFGHNHNGPCTAHHRQKQCCSSKKERILLLSRFSLVSTTEPFLRRKRSVTNQDRFRQETGRGYRQRLSRVLWLQPLEQPQRALVLPTGRTGTAATSSVKDTARNYDSDQSQLPGCLGESPALGLPVADPSTNCLGVRT